MPRNLTAAMLTAIAGQKVYPVWLADIEFTTGHLYLWTGLHDLSWNGQTWVPVGGNGLVKQITDAGEIRAQGVKLQLSGIPSAQVALIIGSVRQGKEAVVYLGLTDEDGALLVDPTESFRGEVDVPQLEDDGDTTTCTISVESHLRQLQRKLGRRYTHEDQQISFPGDLGLEFAVKTASGLISFAGGTVPRAGAGVSIAPRVR